jgi:hypothetical protein
MGIPEDPTARRDRRYVELPAIGSAACIAVDHCLDAWMMNAGGFTCSEIDALALLVARTHSPADAVALVAAHAEGDDVDDSHYLGEAEPLDDFDFADDDAIPPDGAHVCEFGSMEIARFTGNPHRKCQVDGCRIVSLDFDDDDFDEDGGE